MYKIIDGELCQVTKIDRKEVDVRINNALARVTNIDNQLRALLEQKNRIMNEISDIKNIIPSINPDAAKMLGLME